MDSPDRESAFSTSHLYIDKYPIDPTATKLILGTIHPHDHEKFRTPFFYGNTNSFWEILSQAFPGELEKLFTVDGIRKFLKNRSITISDTIVRCDRRKSSSYDEDLINIELNYDLIPQITNSNIKTIYFTSGFGKNNAFRLFYERILKQKITKEIRQSREIILDPKIFGREVKLMILYSPSGAANVAFATHPDYLNNKDKYKSLKPVAEFKAEYFRKKFND
jgi:G:T/U-mismatch repair DNA glycosylase